MINVSKKKKTKTQTNSSKFNKAVSYKRRASLTPCRQLTGSYSKNVSKRFRKRSRVYFSKFNKGLSRPVFTFDARKDLIRKRSIRKSFKHTWFRLTLKGWKYAIKSRIGTFHRLTKRKLRLPSSKAKPKTLSVVQKFKLSARYSRNRFGTKKAVKKFYRHQNASSAKRSQKVKRKARFLINSRRSWDKLNNYKTYPFSAYRFNKIKNKSNYRKVVNLLHGPTKSVNIKVNYDKSIRQFNCKARKFKRYKPFFLLKKACLKLSYRQKRWLKRFRGRRRRFVLRRRFLPERRRLFKPRWLPDQVRFAIFYKKVYSFRLALRHVFTSNIILTRCLTYKSGLRRSRRKKRFIYTNYFFFRRSMLLMYNYFHLIWLIRAHLRKWKHHKKRLLLYLHFKRNLKTNQIRRAWKKTTFLRYNVKDKRKFTLTNYAVRFNSLLYSNQFNTFLNKLHTFVWDVNHAAFTPRLNVKNFFINFLKNLVSLIRCTSSCVQPSSYCLSVFSHNTESSDLSLFWSQWLANKFTCKPLLASNNLPCTEFDLSAFFKKSVWYKYITRLTYYCEFNRSGFWKTSFFVAQFFNKYNKLLKSRNRRVFRKKSAFRFMRDINLRSLSKRKVNLKKSSLRSRFKAFRRLKKLYKVQRTSRSTRSSKKKTRFSVRKVRFFKAKKHRRKNVSSFTAGYHFLTELFNLSQLMNCVFCTFKRLFLHYFLRYSNTPQTWKRLYSLRSKRNSFSPKTFKKFSKKSTSIISYRWHRCIKFSTTFKRTRSRWKFFNIVYLTSFNRRRYYKWWSHLCMKSMYFFSYYARRRATRSLSGNRRYYKKRNFLDRRQKYVKNKVIDFNRQVWHRQSLKGKTAKRRNTEKLFRLQERVLNYVFTSNKRTCFSVFFWQNFKRLYYIFFINILINDSCYTQLVKIFKPGQEFFTQILSYLAFKRCTRKLKFKESALPFYVKKTKSKSFLKKKSPAVAEVSRFYDLFVPKTKKNKNRTKFKSPRHNLKNYIFELNTRKKWDYRNFINLLFKLKKSISRSVWIWRKNMILRSYHRRSERTYKQWKRFKLVPRKANKRILNLFKHSERIKDFLPKKKPKRKVSLYWFFNQRRILWDLLFKYILNLNFTVSTRLVKSRWRLFIKKKRKYFKSLDFNFLQKYFVSYMEINFRIRFSTILNCILNDSLNLSTTFSKPSLRFFLTSLYRHY